jgi:hypothetical protein
MKKEEIIIIPTIAKIKQKFKTNTIHNLDEKIRYEMDNVDVSKMIKPNDKIAITVGSRGIDNIDKLVISVVNKVKECGGKPVIIPAMGSHGGATDEGQIKVLKTLGITEDKVGAKILSSMEVEKIGVTKNNAPVYLDKNALNCDGIILMNRVKAHTDFRGNYESGLMKIMAVGLGKHTGCSTMHSYGLSNTIPQAARIIMENAPILFGIAIVENALDKTEIIKAIPKDKIDSIEPELLKKSKALMPTLPFSQLDLLIVYEMGKSISGTGMDTNVLGRFKVRGVKEPKLPDYKKIAVLNLRDDSYGNALGVGLADLTTRKLVDSIDYDAMYANVIPTSFLERGKIPVILENDFELVNTALKTIGPVENKSAKIVIIKNTMELEEFYVSDALAPEIEENSNLEYISDFKEWKFKNNNFIWN